MLVPDAPANTAAKTIPVDLHGGALPAVKQFITHSLPADKSLHPIIIGLKKLTVVESALAGGRIEGHITLGLSFYLKREDTVIHLSDYNGGAVYNRYAGQSVEPTLRLALKNSLVYINSWMDKQAGSNVKLAKAVKLTFTDYKEAHEGDTIYYSPKRPLTWEDFQSKIPGSKFDAEVFPTIGYEEHTEINKGIISVRVTLKVALPKSASWAKESSRTDYALNHEQRHFDIAKIAAERFMKKVEQENLPVDNYDGYINVDYLDAYREMSNMQKLYDSETRHGSNQAAQQQWNEKIDKELGK